MPRSVGTVSLAADWEEDREFGRPLGMGGDFGRFLRRCQTPATPSVLFHFGSTSVPLPLQVEARLTMVQRWLTDVQRWLIGG